jgi:hypothetical protein
MNGLKLLKVKSQNTKKLLQNTLLPRLLMLLQDRFKLHKRNSKEPLNKELMTKRESSTRKKMLKQESDKSNKTLIMLKSRNTSLKNNSKELQTKKST